MNRFKLFSRLRVRPDPVWLVAALLVVCCARFARGGDVPIPALPADLSQANLRVAAIDMLYELDLSVDQLHTLKGLAVNTGSGRPRAHAANAKFAALLERFQVALLEGGNDQLIAKLRGDVTDQVESVEGLDDQVEPTGPAMTNAPRVAQKLRASQVAAFLASHADDVNDPAERMVEAVEEIRLATPADASNIARKISQDVGRMVAGLDPEKSKAVADKVMDWLKGPTSSKDELNETQRAALEQSAAKVIGDVSNMDVLSHWLDAEIAVLLSNPQLPEAIDALGNAKLKAQQHAAAAAATPAVEH